MPNLSNKPVPGLPPVWRDSPADHANKPTGKIYEKPSWLDALLIMRRIARDRHMPFAAYVGSRETLRRYPPPLY